MIIPGRLIKTLVSFTTLANSIARFSLLKSDAIDRLVSVVLSGISHKSFKCRSHFQLLTLQLALILLLFHRNRAHFGLVIWIIKRVGFLLSGFLFTNLAK